jgi:hypothetical protein
MFVASILVFWVVTPCVLEGRSQRFGGTYFLNLQGWMFLRSVGTARMLHGAVSQKTKAYLLGVFLGSVLSRAEQTKVVTKVHHVEVFCVHPHDCVGCTECRTAFSRHRLPVISYSDRELFRIVIRVNDATFWLRSTDHHGTWLSHNRLESCSHSFPRVYCSLSSHSVWDEVNSLKRNYG